MDNGQGLGLAITVMIGGALVIGVAIGLLLAWVF